MAEKKLIKNKSLSKEDALKQEQKELYEQESAGIKQDEQFLAKLKVLFFKEAEAIADKNLSWEKKCRACIKLVDEQNIILRKIRSNTSILFKLTEKSEKVIDEEETELFLKRHTSQEGAAIAGITTELNKAKNMSALLEKMNFLVLYDLDMLLQDQMLRKQLYEKSVKELSADTSKQDFIKNQYSRLIKACRYLNEMLKYVLGEKNLSKYEIFIEEKMQRSFKI